MPDECVWEAGGQRVPQKNVGKQNFNYCNESCWRAGEIVAFVWSQQELILAGSCTAIHHQRNNSAVVGGMIRNTRGEHQRGRMCSFSAKEGGAGSCNSNKLEVLKFSLIHEHNSFKSN